MAPDSDDTKSVLGAEEYTMLSDQKAQDWRSISEVNPALFGVAGALFAAGVAQQQAFVVAFSPVPLFLGVWHMVRHARLQQQMITYLAQHSPAEQASWESDLRAALPLYRRERSHGHAPTWFARLMRPSAWNTWLGISVVVAIGANLVPLLHAHGRGYSDRGWALVTGVALVAICVVVIAYQSWRIETDGDLWEEVWREQAGTESNRN